MLFLTNSTNCFLKKGTNILSMNEKKKKKYVAIKRVFDIAIALAVIIILIPLFILVVLAIKIESKGPIVFKQKRVGIKKTHFYIFKFRTMRIDTPKDTPTHMLENPQQWITKVGGVLRKTSIDELPQIFNIIKGEMSFIGPRPALWNQHDLIEERDNYGANDVLPGLTGWAQINGRDTISIKEKAQFDGVYSKEISLLMDMKCLVGTVVCVLKKDGFSEGGGMAKK